LSRWPNIPYSPRRWPFFYGWFILGVGTLGVLASVPGQTMGVSPFTDSLIATLDLSRSQLSLAYLFGTSCSALLLTPAGKLYDRLGARVMGTGVCLALGGVLVYLSLADRVAAQLAGMGLDKTVAAFLAILVGFWALRFTGQGVLTLIGRNMVMKWFDHHRGLANGIMAVFVGLGFSGAPFVLNQLRRDFGWRGAWRFLAVEIGVLFAVLVWVTWRDNPEQCGLQPDGASDELTAQRGRLRPVRKQFTLAEAVRTYSFWAFSLSLAMFGLYQTGLTFHIVSIFARQGMGEEVAFSIFFPAALISIPLSLVGGWIADHVPLKALLAFMLGGLVTSMAGLVMLEPGAAYWAVVIGNGICAGLFGVLSAFTWPKYYGRVHLGAISGLNMALVVVGSAIGPLLFSLGLDWTGSYASAALVCLVVSAGLLLGSWKADDPHPETPVVREEPRPDRPE
jgi:MFS family permease